MLKRIVVLSAFLILILYVVVAYDTSQQMHLLDIEIVDITTDGFIVKITNPTQYTYEISRLELKIIADGEIVASAHIESPVVVKPGDSVLTTAKVDVGLLGWLSIMFSNNVSYEISIDAKPSIAHIPLPSVSYTYLETLSES